MPNLNVSHPGEVLQELLVDMEGFSISELSIKFGLDETTVRELLEMRIDVNEHIAQKIAVYMYSGPEMWLNMQASYDKAMLIKAAREQSA